MTLNDDVGGEEGRVGDGCTCALHHSQAIQSGRVTEGVTHTPTRRSGVGGDESVFLLEKLRAGSGCGGCCCLSRDEVGVRVRAQLEGARLETDSFRNFCIVEYTTSMGVYAGGIKNGKNGGKI
ncbi:hypothetical protein EVAR_88065_1 [Eumeta japonica]|uniref:Uncharacterized protein n=1 Tax=Eumeta variegata TaxID=151549 RepID=A0A4C1WHA1_EUMVA|nr:hypothetical protein EVAR_88065_1 [Eumeta japonica]